MIATDETGVAEPSQREQVTTGRHKSRTQMPDYLKTLVESCPTAGEGVNNWVFRVARALNPLYPNKADLAMLIRAGSSKCGREVSDAEIKRAIVNSGTLLREARANLTPSRPRWPQQDPEAIAKAIAAGPTVAALRQQSPVRFEDTAPSRAEEVIDVLFPGNPLLCVASSKRTFDTRRRELWRGVLEQQEFIVPSPMSASTGKTKEGKASRHTLSNTGPRRFLVIEFDPPKWESLGDDERSPYASAEAYYTAKRDEHAELHFHLGCYAPLTLVVHSGGKSLHGWFFCQGQDDALLRRFMAYAISLGADPATWTKSQFVRLPEGYRRDKKKLQSVIYFNPATIKN